MIRYGVALLLLHTLLAGVAPAQTRPSSAFDGQPVTRVRTSAETPHDGVDWQRLVVAMAIVIGLIVALRYAAGWLVPGARATPGGKAARVLGRTAIGPRQQVLLIQVGRRVLVVGDSAGTLSPLANIDEPDEVAELLGRVSASVSENPGRFGRLFGRAKDDFDALPPMPPPGEGEAYVDDADDDDGPNAAPTDPQVAAARDDIAGILDKMRSITKTIRR